jgi:hypothetical protein
MAVHRVCGVSGLEIAYVTQKEIVVLLCNYRNKNKERDK